MRLASGAGLALLLVGACRAADAQGTEASDEALTGKLNLYVYCVNQVSRQVLESVVDAPTVTDPIAERCLSNLEKGAGTRPPLVALEQAGTAYARALVAFRKDGGHGALEAADTALRHAIDEVQHTLDEHALARLEQGGGLEFHTRRVVARAEAMVKAFVAGDASIPRVMGEFLAAARALDIALANGDPETAVSGPISLLASSARNLIRHANSGSVPALVEEYNRMVGYWNMLTWRR